MMKCCLTDQFMVFNWSDLPTILMVQFNSFSFCWGWWETASSRPLIQSPLSFWSFFCLCHCNWWTGRPSLLLSLYSKHKQDYIHTIQMRRNAWRQVQAGIYSPCLQMCSSTQWIYGVPISEGDVTGIYPNVTSEKPLLNSSYTFLNIWSDIWRCGSGVHRSSNRWKDKLDHAWAEWS